MSFKLLFACYFSVYASITLQVSRIQQEHDKREMNLLSCHKDEIKRIQLQAENELREVLALWLFLCPCLIFDISHLVLYVWSVWLLQKTISLRNEHDAQLSALRCKHEDDCRRLQEELDIQKSKVCPLNYLLLVFAILSLLCLCYISISGGEAKGFIAVAMESNGWQFGRRPRSDFKEG